MVEPSTQLEEKNTREWSVCARFPIARRVVSVGVKDKYKEGGEGKHTHRRRSLPRHQLDQNCITIPDESLRDWMRYPPTRQIAFFARVSLCQLNLLWNHRKETAAWQSKLRQRN